MVWSPSWSPPRARCLPGSVVAVQVPLPEFEIAACTTAEALARRPVAALWASLTARGPTRP